MSADAESMDYCLHCNPPPRETGPWEGPNHTDMRFGNEQGACMVTLNHELKMTTAARAGSPGWIRYYVADDSDPAIPAWNRLGIDCPHCVRPGVIRETRGDVRIYWGSNYVEALLRGHQPRERAKDAAKSA